MPNLQQWLNAWVNVNVPPKATTRSRSRSRNNRHSSSKHPSSGHGAIRGMSGTGAHHAESEVLENIGAVEEEFESTYSPSLTSTSDSPATSSILSVDPELAAIRKFNSKKHKRRLHRTNSFSDILREKAENSKSRSNRGSSNNGISQRYSVERDRLSGYPDVGQGRRQDHHSRQHRHHRPPPPSLHHTVLEDEKQGAHRDASEVSSSQQGESPTETATTVQRSNKHNSNSTSGYPHSDDDEHSIASSNSAALFEVADFLGTERRVTGSSTRKTHRAQHGGEDEQPHYLRSYIHPTNTYTHDNNLQHSSTTNTYTNHSRSGESNNRYHPTSNTTSARLHHTNSHLQPARAYPPIPANRYYDQATSSALIPPSQTAIEASAPASATEPTETGLLFGGVRLSYFSVAPAASDSNAG